MYIFTVLYNSERVDRVKISKYEFNAYLDFIHDNIENGIIYDYDWKKEEK